jgi:phenol hydroxylase P1 protein
VQVDIKTSDIRPIRQTFAQVARRIGGDKPASRYQEATLHLQAETNFHYRPLWQPEFELYDKGRTAIAMADWYAFKDPRHYYYGAYTTTRARQQEGADKQFEFAEKRNLLGGLDVGVAESLRKVLVPLRHYEWGANMNNTYCASYGWGTAVTQACTFAAMDRLGIAQYISRIGLLLDGNVGSGLEAAKREWLDDPAWQGVRRVMENLFVTKDVFEVLLAQNLVFDGLVYPLIHRHYEQSIDVRAGQALAMLTSFIADWYDETARWVDATVKTAADESAANQSLLSQWYRTHRDEMAKALEPLATLALGTDPGATALHAVRGELDARAAKLGLKV